MGSRLERNSNSVRKRIENHTFDNEEGEEYEGSKFGGFSDYFRRKKIKLQNLDAELRSHTSNNPPIFRGVVAHVNGYTQPSLNDLHRLIVSHGGGFMQYLDGKTTVTHIIASSLTPKKAVEFKRYRIVKPAWIVDSVKAGRLLPWDSYRVLDEGVGQKVLEFDNGQVVSQAPKQSKGYRDQTDTSWYTNQLKNDSDLPKSSGSSSFLKQRPPTPDELEDEGFPSSHQSTPIEDTFNDQDDVYSLEDPNVANAAPSNIVTPHTPPKTSPTVEPEDPIHETKEDVPALRTGLDAGLTENQGKDSRKRSGSAREETPSKRVKLTAEEHNARLLADPNIRKSTVVNPDFLEQYYRESRLHHLSTWKADLKSQLQSLAMERSASQKARQKRSPGARRYILHVDFDSFFVAVSLKKYPQFKDKPCVVAHGNGTGSEIASCNYPARKFGIKNGMWMKRAQDLCPDLKILPYDFPAYEEASRAFYDAILGVGGIVQSVSVDEALLDVSGLCVSIGGSDGKKLSEGSIYREQAKADEIAQALREEVKRRTGCEVSVGIGGNILLAKVALRKAKPAGQYQIKPEETLEFIGNLEAQDLPGVAYSIGGKLEEIGIKYVKDIREFTREKLVSALGPKTGEKIWEYARGIDRAEVGEQAVRKSVSAEVNWGVRFENQTQVDEFIHSLCGELSKRLLKEKVKGRQLTMKIMRRSADAPLDPPKHLGHGKCDTFNKSIVLGVATNAPDILAREALSILKGFGFSPGELRGIGLQMTKLEPLKTVGDGQLESSQRRLQFKTNPKPAPPQEPKDAIQDDVETPKKPRALPDQVKFGAENLNMNSPSKRPLNTLGTQFILPSQVDPKVLAELSEDIRAKLVKEGRASSSSPAPKNVKPRTTQSVLTSLPSASQLDPETLNALPEDLRAEILAEYEKQIQRSAPSSPRKPPQQALLPQSPHKNRTLPPLRKPAPPAPRKRGRPPKQALFSGPTPAASGSGSHATLTQANFLTTRPRVRPQASGAQDTSGNDTGTDSDSGLPPEPDPDYLAALPEDIRREVLAEHRRARLRALNLNVSRVRAGVQQGQQPMQPMQRTLLLPPRAPRPTFSTQKLWTPQQLREAVTAWVREFKDDGPYVEDVGALVKYLKKVIADEKDMEKAVGVGKWLVWVVDEEVEVVGKDGIEARKKWDEAIEIVRKGIGEAVQERGLGEVVF